jgi:hypothetical protein
MQRAMGISPTCSRMGSGVPGPFCIGCLAPEDHGSLESV